MQMPKRRQMLLVHQARTLMGSGGAYLVLVTKVGPRTRSRKRSCRVLCLARNVTANRLWMNPDDEWSIKPHGIKIELVGKADLPLYIGWEHGSAFGRVLKGEL
jgi:hypothetical protein